MSNSHTVLTGFITIVKPNRPNKMAYIAPMKVTPKQVLTFITQFHKRYAQLPHPKQIAAYFRVTPQTIYMKLNTLEDQGFIDRIKVIKHSTSYRLRD